MALKGHKEKFTNLYKKSTGKKSSVNKEVTIKRDTVVLLGTSETLIDTVWDREDCDYWCCFSVMTQSEIKNHRIDAMFELHTIETWGLYEDNIIKAQKEYPNAVIYTQQKYKQIKNSVRYPIEDVQEMVGNIYLRKYFTSSIAYMIALAILHGYKKIILYGVSLAAEEEEYSSQRSCAEAWLNFGLGRGTNYEIAQPAALMASNYLYGYEPHKDVMIKLVQLKEAIKNARDDISKRLNDLNEERLIQEGGVRMMDHLIRSFGGRK